MTKALIAHENILRFSQDCLRSTLAGHFQSREIGGNAQLAACCSSFSSGSVCKKIAVDGEQKGVRGGGCGRPASGGLSFSITKSVATKHPVDVTSHTLPAATGQCYSYIIAADQTDGWRDVWRAWSGVCVGGMGRRVCGRRAHLPPVPANLSPTMHGGDSRGPAGRPEHGWTDRRAGGPECGGAR